MSDLARFFASYGRYAADPTAAGLEALVAAHPGWRPDPRRMAIYGRHARIYVDGPTSSIHEACRAAVDQATWQALLDGWYATRPAKSFELNHSAHGFCDWLEARREVPPWLAQLARLEWTLFAAAAFGDPPVDEGPLHPNPSLVVLELDWQLCAYLAHQPPRPAPAPGRELALVWRDPSTLRARWRTAGERELLALKIAAESIPLEAVVQAGAGTLEEVRALLDDARRVGLLCGAP